jgi:hypothetical protein
MYNAIRIVDGEIKVHMSVLEELQRRHIDELRPIYEIQFDELIKKQAISGAEKRWLAERKQELFPAFIEPFSDRKLIYEKSRKISRFIREIVCYGLSYDDDFWAELHRAFNLVEGHRPLLSSAETTAYWYRKLRKQVRRASFIFSSLISNDKSLASHKYVMYRRHLTPQSTYTTPWGKRTRSQLQNRRQHARHSSYLTRVTGIAELNIEAGRAAYFVTVTLKPKFKKANVLFNGLTPDKLTKLIAEAVRKLTDKLRYHGIDLDAVKVLEAQADGTPHLHFLIFTKEIDLILQIIEWAFVDRQEISCKQGIHMTPVYDLKGVISYILKSFLPEMSSIHTIEIPDEIKSMQKLDEDDEVKADKVVVIIQPTASRPVTHTEQIQAWSEFTSNRRFAVISTKRSYPPLALWDDCRQGEADLLNCSFIKKHFQDSYRSDLPMLASLNAQLNDIAANGNYAMFCRVLWLYSNNVPDNFDHGRALTINMNLSAPDPAVAMEDKPSPALSIETLNKADFPQLRLSDQVNFKSNKNITYRFNPTSLWPAKYHHYPKYMLNTKQT